MLKPLIRIALINTSPQPVELSIKTADAVGWCELLSNTPVAMPESDFVKRPAAQPWDAVIEPGRVYGFITMQGAQFSVPSSIVVVHADGKDPWPKPPPPAPAFKKEGDKESDYEARFAAFLLAGTKDEEYEHLVVTRTEGEGGMTTYTFTPPRERTS